jgi:hypothetical protein
MALPALAAGLASKRGARQRLLRISTSITTLTKGLSVYVNKPRKRR